MPKITFQPDNQSIEVPDGTTVLEAELKSGLSPDSPCGGHGKCGKCRVFIDGRQVLACQTLVHGDMTVSTLPEPARASILTDGIDVSTTMDVNTGLPYLAAVDIGTTTMVCYLLSAKDGAVLSTSSMLNPQYPYGADVISRIQDSLKGRSQEITSCVRTGVDSLIIDASKKISVSPKEIGAVCFVGNPAMQQMFLGIGAENLASPPFSRVLTATGICPAAGFLPSCPEAELLCLPDIAGYVGADTVACVLSTRMYEQSPVTLMLDIGTNGEMVLGNSEKMAATSTAAGPALEGAGITFGMRGAEGAIDHVSLDGENLTVHVIGEGPAIGICGSGLIDAVACLLDLGVLNKRGRIGSRYVEEDSERRVYLTDRVYLSQDDIRAVQMAKGAIAAGIEILARTVGVDRSAIDRVLLAGAFGSFISPKSACRIGLIPPELEGRITAVGNAAGSGAILSVSSRIEFARTDALVSRIEPVELSAQADFQKIFAKNMMFAPC